MRPTSTWLWLLLIVQVVLPASYYLRDDEDEERFAWRMFSAVRLKQCAIGATERFGGAHGGEREVELSSAVHASWQRSLERGRQRVIERFLQKRCTIPPAEHPPPSGLPPRDRDALVVSATLTRRCVSPDGEDLPEERYTYDCHARRLELTK